MALTPRATAQRDEGSEEEKVAVLTEDSGVCGEQRAADQERRGDPEPQEWTSVAPGASGEEETGEGEEGEEEDGSGADGVGPAGMPDGEDTQLAPEIGQEVGKGSAGCAGCAVDGPGAASKGQEEEGDDCEGGDGL